jgi:hypothetical protein
VYTSEKARKWIEVDLVAAESTWKLELSPAEQMAELIEHFCSGEPLAYGWQFKPLTHIGDGVWELKTPETRLFGWFPKKDCFIGSEIGMADHIKRHKLYRGHVDEVVRFRDMINLDEPKFIDGDSPNDVVSDFYFPE